MKKLKNVIVVSFFVLVVLIGFYCIVKKNPEKKETNKIYFEIEAKKLKNIKVQKDGEKPFNVFKYGIDNLKNVPLNKEQIDELFGFFSKIETNHIFLPKENLAAYGLNKPVFKFFINSNGSNYNISVGNKTFEGDGYYIYLEDKTNKNKEIAVVKSYLIEHILKPKFSYVDLKLIKPYEKTFGSDGKYNGDGVQKCCVTGKNSKNILKFQVNEKGEVVVFPKTFKLTDKVKTIIEKGPQFLIAKDVFSIKPSEEQLEKCGLKNPKAEIYYVIDYCRYKIRIGNLFKIEQLPNYKSEESVKSLKYYYVLVEGKDVIYILNENVLPWLEFDY